MQYLQKRKVMPRVKYTNRVLNINQLSPKSRDSPYPKSPLARKFESGLESPEETEFNFQRKAIKTFLKLEQLIIPNAQAMRKQSSVSSLSIDQ